MSDNPLQDWMDERDELRIRRQEADHRCELLHAEIERLKVADKYAHKTVERLDAEVERLRAAPDVDIEALSARLHDIYQKEAHRRGDIRHDDDYAALPDLTKEWDRVLARWIVQHWHPVFDPSDGLPPA